MAAAMTIIERIERLGIRVSAEDGMILLEGNIQDLTDEQVEWIKEHKPAILRELRERIVSKLGVLAKVHHVPLDDLLDWYRDDIEDMTRFDDQTLAWLVEDYADLRAYYRREQPTCRTPEGPAIAQTRRSPASLTPGPMAGLHGGPAQTNHRPTL